MEDTVTMNPEEAKGLLENIVAYFDPEKMLLRLIVAAIIIVVAMIATKIVSKLFKNLMNHNKISSIFATLMRKTIKAIIWAIAAIAILQDFGINLTPVIAGLGISGVVLGLALQETIASFFSGLIIAVKKPFEIGDYVTIDGTGGTVRSMDMMGITLTTPDNKMITMSNKNVWGSVIINTSALDVRRVDMTISVSYESDYEKAREVISDLLSSYPEVLKDPAPTIEVNMLSASSVDFIVRPWTKNSDYWTVYWKFQKEIVPALSAKGVEVPYNKLDITVRKD